MRSAFIHVFSLLISGLALAGDDPAATNAVTTSSPAPRPVVYVIPIHGPIEPALLYIVRRGVTEAVRQKADAVVFTMDTPGGTVDDAREIIHTLRDIPVPTYTLVEKNAFSAGAIIALATKKIYMTPGSVIGDAMPILMTPFSGPQALPESLQEKMVSGVAALIRAAAEQGGHDKELAEAMVRREVGYTVDGKSINQPGHLLTLTDQEASRVRADGKPLLSAGTIANLDELLQREKMFNADVHELRVSASEHVARWIQAFSFLFLAAGLLGIYIEIKTPGFGLPGVLGILCLAVFFWGHHIAGLAGQEDLAIFLLGAILVAVEVFVLPGFGLAGAAGILLMLVGLGLAMVQRYPAGPWYPQLFQLSAPGRSMGLALAIVIASGWALARILPRTAVYHQMMLQTANARSRGYAAADTRRELIGKTGIAVTDLRPAGTMRLDESRIDVVTRGDFVKRGDVVRIVEAQGARIVVEPAAPANG